MIVAESQYARGGLEVAPRASMGPQLDSCGKSSQLPLATWNRSASMGPQLDSCGKTTRKKPARAPGKASMGPQLDSCGKPPPLERKSRPSFWLQWGRNLIVAESSARRPSATWLRVLQWGRNLIVAESLHPRTYPLRHARTASGSLATEPVSAVRVAGRLPAAPRNIRWLRAPPLGLFGSRPLVKRSRPPPSRIPACPCPRTGACPPRPAAPCRL